MINRNFQIALLSSGLGHVMRGVETWTEDIGRALYQNGVMVNVYKGGGKAQYSYEKIIPCIRRASKLSQWIIHRRPGFLWHFGLGSGYSLEQMTFCWSIFPQLLLRQFDVIHTQDPNIALFCQRLFRLKLIRSKIILAHGTEESFEFLSKFDYLQHLAPFHQKEAFDNAVRNKKDFVISNAVDTVRFTPGQTTKIRKEFSIPDDAFVVLSVAAIKRHHKRIDYLIDEISRIGQRNVYILVAGAREAETDEVMSYARERLGDRAVFLINFPRERIWELYAAADLFVLCSLKEMLGIVILEAMASGVPAIVHKYPVVEWVVGDGGESVDMTQPGALSHVIRKYRDSGYLQKKSRKAREQAVMHFSKEVIVSKVLKMYEEVL